MKRNIWIIVVSFLMMPVGVASSKENKKETDFIANNVTFATHQTALMLKNLGEPTGKNYPRTIDAHGKLATTPMSGWTSGFFAGSLWYLYELTGDSMWKKNAQKWTASLEPIKTFTDHHDIGFMMNSSYGNAYRLTSEAMYKDVLIESAGSLSTRFSEKAATIKSWNYRKAWNDSVEWFYPVIIDNMMNLELLTTASKLSGDKQFSEIAVAHANTTLKHHFREDFSTYHVVDYDAATGEVKDQATCQGYSDNSTWARGQAWAIYGYIMMYRETKKQEYLEAAINAADLYLKNLPDDLIPVWDFNVGEEGYTPEGKSYATEFKEKLKDVSAAAIVCSALFELGQYELDKGYLQLAVNMLYSLSSPAYRADPGTHYGFLLKHSVGSIPHKAEIDVPLIYSDYYYLEALVRYKRMVEQKQRYQSFTPKQLWFDNNGMHINAHGGGILYDKGTYYWFGEHKIAGDAGNKAQVGVRCYSSKDLYNWTNEGVALAVDPLGSGSDIEKGCILERPKVIYNAQTKKYVMWFHLELKSLGYKAARSGVAVSDHITGPYKFIKSMRPNAGHWPMNVLSLHKSGHIPSQGKSYTGAGMPAHTDSLNILGRDFQGGQMARDMTLFVDTDGKAYHIYSSEENSTTHIAELSDDYLSHTGRYVRVFVNRYMEAPAILKRNGKYYFIGSGCTGWAPNAARSAVAESIWGPWEELGNPCRGANSELTFGGQSTYILNVQGMQDAYLFMADEWRPNDAIDGRYIWLPITFENDNPLIYWENDWQF